MFFFVLFEVFLFSNGFLLDGDNPTPTDATGLSDKHYNTLMDLLIDERRSRKKLEEAVTRELLTLKEQVAACHCGNANSNTGTKQTNNNAFNSNDTRTLKEDFLNLERDYNALKVQFTELVKNNSAVNVRVHQVEHNLSSIQPSQSVCYIGNETKRLEKDLQLTNNKLNVVTNDVDARKQDFIALFNMLKDTEQLLDNKTKSLQLSQNITASGFKQQLVTLSNEVSEAGKRLENKTKLLEVSQNLTASRLRREILQETRLGDKSLADKQTKVQQELDKMANRVLLTACKDSSYTMSGVIKFNRVKTVIGIRNINSIRNSGIFTCEKAGIYLISVYIQTATNNARFDVKKNGDVISEGFTTINGNAQTTSVTWIQHLDVNDKISVIAIGSVYVYGDYESCLTIMQIL